MRVRLSILIGLAAATPVAVTAQAPTATTAAQPASAPVTIESYYRIRWGSSDEFLQLYRRNHAPILDEMRRLGFITAIRTDQPFTHMAGDQRWDLRVTITYRDADSAVTAGGAFDQASLAAARRLFPDREAHNQAEARRFALLEEHWDVIVVPNDPD